MRSLLFAGLGSANSMAIVIASNQQKSLTLHLQRCARKSTQLRVRSYNFLVFKSKKNSLSQFFSPYSKNTVYQCHFGWQLCRYLFRPTGDVRYDSLQRMFSRTNEDFRQSNSMRLCFFPSIHMRELQNL